MTIGNLVLIITVSALLLTLVIGLSRNHKNWVLTFLQNFCGVLFLISGAVKAVDALGTAYKMEQYFAEFEATFADTAFGFLAPIFPFFSEYSIAFSVFMIVLEIVVGFMLLMGMKSKLTAWIFLIIVVFFTILTGFTFLTGYVPSGENFFSFGKWGPYLETNMRVTDCGCFGDFLKLEPRTSFFKDIVLLVPSLIFVFRHKKMHELFTPQVRAISTAGLGIATLFYCFSNFAWDIPHVDFRPFKEGVNIRDQKQIEEEALANVEILGYKLTNKSTDETIELAYDTYLKNYAEYPKADWEFEQLLGDPEVEPTKISDFRVEDLDGNNVTDDILSNPKYSFMIVCHKVYVTGEEVTRTIFEPYLEMDLDTLNLDTSDPQRARTILDSLQVLLDSTVQRAQKVMEYTWDSQYLEEWKQVDAFLEAGSEAGVDAFAIVGGANAEMIASLKKEAEFQFPIYQADDILLKTIVRSNPGVVLLQDGKVIKKWHKSKLPDFAEVRDMYMK